jgi:hypothetical protein
VAGGAQQQQQQQQQAAAGFAGSAALRTSLDVLPDDTTLS